MWSIISLNGCGPYAPHLLFKVTGEADEPGYIVATSQGIIWTSSSLYSLSI